VPQKSEHKRLKIDLSGLHPLDELKSSKIDTKASSFLHLGKNYISQMLRYIKGGANFSAKIKNEKK